MNNIKKRAELLRQRADKAGANISPAVKMMAGSALNDALNLLKESADLLVDMAEAIENK